MKQWFLFLALGVVFLLGTTTNNVQAQQFLTIALPPFLEAILDEAIVDEFEAQNGVEVEFIYDLDVPSGNNAPQTTDDIEAYTEDLLAYMSSADVLIVDDFLSPEITRAGYALDLTPLISADSFLNPNDFYTSVWESFTWDGGMWALPIASQPLFVDYNTEAFDEAGLSYPNQSWLLEDFEFAVRELTQYDEDGEVSLPGMVVSTVERAALFRALLGIGFYDFNSFPESPSLSNPQLADLIDLWTELIADGVIEVGGGFGGQADDIPILLSSGGSFSFTILDDDGNETDGGGFVDEAPERALAPLPNGESVLLSAGLAVSSGTSTPDLAYSLVRYLSEQQTFADAIIGSEPARNIYFTDAESTNNFQISFGDDRSEEELALVTNALENGLPTSEIRFYPYLNAAISKVQNGETDAVSALEEVELDALEVIQTMDDLNVAFTVEAGIPIAVAEGEIILNFGFQSFITPLPNQTEWDEAIATFVANDPEVGAVDLDLINIAQSILGGGNSDRYDCTYYSSTFFVDIDSELLLALDPLLFSDLNYNVNDLPFGALELLQLNGVAYGLPIVIQPQMLQYDPEPFGLAGLPEPIGGWTISEFSNALELLSFVLEEDEAPFVAQGFDNTYLLMLMAAQGGLPIDTRTLPPTIDYTSPESLNAVQTILDWVDAGYIDQASPDDGGFGDDGEDDDTTTPIVPTFFAGFGDPDLSYTTYPTGITYTPVSFDVGAGYISIDTALPEACFRWLSFISTQPELFIGGMPAQISLLDTPRVQNALGADTAEAYRTIADMMAAPNVINFNATDPFLSTWLQAAINAYLNEDADLLTELEDAQRYTLDYLACSSNIELELSIQTFQALNTCVENVNSAQID